MAEFKTVTAMKIYAPLISTMSIEEYSHLGTLLPKKIIYIITNNGSSNMIDRTGFIVRLPK